jgi:hypothetical protein
MCTITKVTPGKRATQVYMVCPNEIKPYSIYTLKSPQGVALFLICGVFITPAQGLSRHHEG